MVQKQTMNWDDTRLFLELARSNSARATAAGQGVSHSTITRRVAQLESDLGVRLFDRDVRGYHLTGAGELLVKSAVQAEEALLTAARQLQGRDAQLSGEIRVTTSNIVATHLLMDDFVEFTRLYPDIDLNILTTFDLHNLSRREADIALRISPLASNPPEDLIGRKLITISNCYYASKTYLEEHDLRSPNSKARWIGWDDEERFPDWVKRSPFPNFPVFGRLNDVTLQSEAARRGMGLTVLPCFYGDKVNGLQRIPGCEPYASFDMWMLSHPDLRDAARMRTFRKFITESIERLRRELAGEL
jgi:DNA-binding transcriptional LysR family regulator